MVHALIFDMDGTMIDSMPSHKRSWAEFAQRQGLEVDISDVMRRTTGRTGIECMRILFGLPEMGEDEAMAHVHVKEAVYRELFSPIFAEVAGFKAFFDHAHACGLKLGVGTAGDRQNQAFAYQHLQMKVAPLTTVGGDEGLPGKPEPAIFLEAARRMGVEPERCIVFEDAPLGIEAARRAGMRAVGIASSHHPDELTGPHVLAVVPDYHALIASRFLETHHVVSS
ncbi:HAD family phosphatase [Rhodoferax sp. TBRC 17660]|uniref:HAD family phosphatase n=1 Tax=Rhodoferax potami TaxID=3068338 RepID=A0ABU3KJS5_9BURK|nr:HAD family phosphatase [Rhodoferax sp. TBRC 17660]MDT7518029.1 HAD family phosphatase [Rhodoferax sp. TBRC 17660]